MKKHLEIYMELTCLFFTGATQKGWGHSSVAVFVPPVPGSTSSLKKTDLGPFARVIQLTSTGPEER